MSPARAALVVLLLALASPAGAGTYSLNGSLGGGYSRDDSWSSSGHQASTTWDWDANLSLAGSPFRPGLLQFLVGARYAALRSYYFSSRSQTDNLGFNVQASAFLDSPLTLSLGAGRAWTEFSSDGQAHLTGATQTTSYNGVAVFNVPQYPSLRLALQRTELDNHRLGGETVQSTTTTLSAGASHATRTQEYSASYDTGWNTGTEVETNYRSHLVNFAGNVALGENLRFRLNDNYYLRLPTNSSPNNPRYDENLLSTGLQWEPTPANAASISYSYGHNLVTAPTHPDLLQVSHELTAADAYQATSDLSLRAAASFGAASEALGSAEETGYSELVGGGATWRRVLSPRLQLNLGGGVSVGAAEPVGGPTLLAGGLAASVGLGYHGPVYQVSGSYNVAYDRARFGLPGSTLSQQLNLLAETALGNLLLRSQLTAADARRDDPLLGTMLSRSASWCASGSWKLFNGQLTLGESDGLSAPLLSPVFSDGLFLPAGYDTHTRYATLTSTLALDGGHILLTALARTQVTTAPGRARTWEDGGGLTGAYALGLFVFSLDERISTGGTGGVQQTGNLVMLRVSRSFGLGF